MSEPKSRRIPKPIWFAVAAVVMVVLAVFLQVWLPYHREQVAIREIERHRAGYEVVFVVLSFGPEWIRNTIGNAWMLPSDRIVSVDFSHTDITDKELKSLCMKHLSGLTELKQLTLNNTQITEETIAEIQRALPNCRIIRK